MKTCANNVKLNLAVGLKKVTDNHQVNTGYVVSLGSGLGSGLLEDRGQDIITKILEDGIGTRRGMTRRGMTQDQAMRNIHIHIHIHIDMTGRQVRNQEDHETVVETMISEGRDMYKVIVHEDPQVLKSIVERLGESLGTRIGRTQGQGMSNIHIHIHMHIHLTGREVMTREYHETVTEKMNFMGQADL